MKYDDLSVSTKVILEVVFAFLAVFFVWTIRDIVVILLLSLILASAMDPLVDYLSDKKVPRVVSVLLVYLIVLGLASFVIYLIIPPVIEQYKFLQANLPQYSSDLNARIGGGFDLASFWKQILSGIGGGSSVINNTFGIFNGVISFVTVLVISFYLVAEEKGMKAFISSFLPEKHQEFTISLLEKIQKKMGMWVLGQVAASVSIFILVFIGLSALKVQYALFLALVAGLLEVMPYIGPIVSSVPAMFFAFIQHPPLAIAVAILYLIIHQIEGYVLVPKIMQKAIGTSPLLVLVALLIGVKLAGIVGLLIAVPLSTAVTVVINEFWPSAKMP